MTKLIPSMFHRRLLLLAIGGGVSLGVLAVQTTRLSSPKQRQKRLEQLQANLIDTDTVPTIRGQILDRNGLVLAKDAPGYDVLIQYRVLDGRWAYEAAKRAAKVEIGDDWVWLTPQARLLAIQEHEARFVKQVDELWTQLANLTGTPREDLVERINNIRNKIQYSKARLWEIWRKQEEKKRGQPVSVSEVAEPIAEENQAHVLIHDVDPKALDQIRNLIALAWSDTNTEVWDEVLVERPKLRLYPQALQTIDLDRSHFPSFAQNDRPLRITVDGVALPLIGNLRGVTGEDVKRKPIYSTNDKGKLSEDLAGYDARNDQIGAYGIERAAEDILRGRRGKRITHLDTRQVQQIPTTPGHDIQLTFDIHLQAQLQALGDPKAGLTVLRHWYNTPMISAPYNAINQSINGASIVLEIKTGHVLAAASWPSPNIQNVRENLSDLYRDSHDMPMNFRPFSRPLPPGSTVKPLIYAMAVTAGKLTADDTSLCLGFLDLNHDGHYTTGPGREPRCWIYKSHHTGHGVLTGRGAIEVSCNTFFYDLGLHVGCATMTDWYSLLGFGQKTGVGIVEESAGSLPSPKLARQLDRLSPMDGVYMGIGQGRISATPIQVANAYATLARGGQVIPPTIYLKGQPTELPGHHETYDLGLDPLAVQVAMAGMRDVVEGRRGSARALSTENGREKLWNIEGIDLIGKSGTAQNDGQAQMIDDDEDGYPDGWGDLVREGNHGWFVTLVKGDLDQDWRYVVVTVMEHAGGGGKTAAPVNNQVHKLLRDAGYLQTSYEAKQETQSTTEQANQNTSDESEPARVG